ncbi:hypothetical protein ACIA8I_40010 [Streptomyces rishiriensis]|uniref:hypothetical protein n=1 Tax=Streptomyces rishiriensis TaxID=68264 RepID=UPI0037B673E9
MTTTARAALALLENRQVVATIAFTRADPEAPDTPPRPTQTDAEFIDMLLQSLPAMTHRLPTATQTMIILHDDLAEEGPARKLLNHPHPRPIPLAGVALVKSGQLLTVIFD